MSDDNQNDAIRLGHEPIALSARAVAKGFSVLYGVVLVSLLLMAGLMILLARIFGGTATVDAPRQAEPIPAGVPVLNSNQRRSLRDLRSRERKVLTEYAWVEAEAGIARIPIKRAMEIMSQFTTAPPQAPNDEPGTQ